MGLKVCVCVCECVRECKNGRGMCKMYMKVCIEVLMKESLKLRMRECVKGYPVYVCVCECVRATVCHL
jgi:hypothetical protein